jgi:sulfate adenylyltransferase subunit 1
LRKISIQQCVGWTVKTIPGAKYFVQHNTNRVLAKIDSENIIATDFSGATEASQLAINEIGEVNIKLKQFILMLTAITNQMVLLS